MKKVLLWLLNKFYNGTPCEYGLINNVEAYERSFLDDTLENNPEVTMKEFLDSMDRMDKCMKSGEDCTIMGKTVYKGSDILIETLNKDML